MEVLVMIGQFLLGFTILVGLHEWGHYITARWFGIRVDRFYIFFDFLFPLQNVMNFALWKKKIGDTEFGLGWFPMGGYAAIAGMVDETTDSSQLASKPEPWEFRSKPAWQRLIVMLGGIIVNVLLGISIFWYMTYKNGSHFYSRDEVNKNGIYASPLAQQIGLQTGDKILKINGKDFERFSDLYSSDAVLGESFAVERKGEQKTIYIPKDFAEMVQEQKKEEYNYVEPIYPFKIGEISPDSPASKAGFKAGDVVQSVGGVAIPFYHNFREILATAQNKTLDIAVNRDGKTLNLSPTISNEGKLGFRAEILLARKNIQYSLFEALGIGTQRAFGVITDNIKGLKKVFNGDLSPTKTFSGPIGIAKKAYGGVWEWDRFWLITAALSMALAFMNLLPIPALDGGHAVILLGEMITGRTPSPKFLDVIQRIGMIILLGLMFFIYGNDIVQAIF